jgi:alkyl hydroperoxide reductase subunit AhpF
MKQIFSKIAKIGEEVRTMKVELSMKDDFDSAFKVAVDKEWDAVNAVQILVKQIPNVERALNDAKAKYVEANATGQKFESAAKELGVDISSGTQATMNLSGSKPQVIDKLIQKLKNIKSELNTF